MKLKICYCKCNLPSIIKNNLLVDKMFVYIARKLLKNNIFYHYYFIDFAKGLEIHHGYYKLGNIIQLHLSPSVEIVGRLSMCKQCYGNIYRIKSYHIYPFENCETLINSFISFFPVSIQVLLATGLVVSVLLKAFILLCIVICYYFLYRFNPREFIYFCPHIDGITYAHDPLMLSD